MLDPGIDQVTREVLLNITANGFNPNAKTKSLTTGGLYINWMMNDPTQINRVNPNTNNNPPTSHDIQTDLFYLNALAEYKYLHPDDTRYDLEIQKMSPIVHYEFFNYNLPKGWVYFYLLRDGFFLNDPVLTEEASMAASNYYTHWYDTNLNLLYNKSHIPGVYSVEHSITAGAALMDAGTRLNQPAWFQAGKSTLEIAVAASYNLQSHLFYNNMSVNSDGTEVVTNDQAKPSTQGSVVEALMEAYMLVHDQQYLDIANQVLQSMLIDSGLWDHTNRGLYFALDLNGGKLEQKYKETRAQAHALIGLYRFNQVMRTFGKPQMYLDKQQQLISLLANKFYEPTYHGYFYRMTPDFQIYVSNDANGQPQSENYFTTEAMGLALDALQQTEMPTVPF
ncbi:D-glucuronyl C5-epimerase family protein [Dictyobacter formicarum]|uniref:D-glucuronyl C5-epimerase C-terminal domain-containing protein n=1 Tax=Dictyobacter formicarum TaxID=2778368 RepID=A0ABQ3VDD8_9CHLR|nr:D-glucuronyl C5-epimerase family protein [Dictyobacter formicarum]GHO83721.1 hypothetical protein KSZ_17270 [Dictyobacter formicarum]